MTVSAFQTLAPIAERVINSVPAGLLIAAFAWLLLRVLKKQNSGTRFAVWFAALVAIAVLPFVMAPNGEGSGAQIATPKIVLPESWAVAIVVVWGMFAAFSIARIFFGMWRLRGLRRDAIAISKAELPVLVQATAEGFDTARRIALCRTSSVRVPTAVGFFRPVILLPEWSLKDLSADELNAIVLHEFAHLRRWDDWTNLVQKVLRAVFCLHPAVWWIEKKLSLEREMACDDLVLAKTENPHGYAECLVSLAEKSLVRRGLAMAQAILGAAHDTALRLAQILDRDRPQSTRVFKPVLALVTIFGGLSVVALSEAPTLVGFQDSAPMMARAAMSDIPPALSPAKVVPARMTVERPSGSVRRSPAAKPKIQDVKTPQVVEAKMTKPHARTQQLVHTVAASSTPPAEMFVVMETTQFVTQDSAVVSFRVWRVTYIPAQAKRAGAEMKSL